MNPELDAFARTIYEMYGYFRVAGFEEDKAFSLATSFMIKAMDMNASPPPEAKND